MNDRDLIRIHADILFRYNASGRMVCSNDPEGRPAPRLFAVRGRGGSVVRFGETVADDLARRLAEIVERRAPAGTLRVPSEVLATVRETLEQDAPVMEEDGGPAYRFPDSLTVREDVVQITEANVELARDTYPWLCRELADWWPCFAMVRDGAAVSVCFSSRLGPTAAEAGVDTLTAFRGRGYAAAVTVAWAAAIRRAGRIPLYSTSWENLASQGVARRLGLIVYGADASWT